MSARLKILVIGGRGAFGGRIVHLPAPRESLTLATSPLMRPKSGSTGMIVRYRGSSPAADL